MANEFINVAEEITLRELLDLPALEELADHILQVHGLGLTLVSPEKDTLLDTCNRVDEFAEIIGDKEAKVEWKTFAKKTTTNLPKRGEIRHADWHSGICFDYVPILNELTVIGGALIGPYRLNESRSVDRDSPKEAIEDGVLKIPQFTKKKVDSTVLFFSSMLDVLVFSSYKRHLTNMAHIEAISDSYKQLQEANGELKESYRQLKELDQMKSNFLAVVSHELRTPLTSIIGYSEMLLEGLGGELNDNQMNYVNVIMEKGDQLLKMIREILNLSKIEAGKMKLVPKNIKPSVIAEQALETIRPSADKKSLNLKLEMEGFEDREFCVDQDKILQVYSNLLSNAVKFSEEGGQITLSVRLVKGDQLDHGLFDTIKDAEKNSEFILSEVRDEGIGIPHEHVEKIFRKFYQVDASSTRVYGGTGLGLAITRSFVDLHGGEIRAKSQPNHGTTISFFIPARVG